MLSLVVVDGMKLDLPDEVMKPFTAARISLERITAFPTQDAKEIDPVRSAVELLRQAEQQAASPSAPAEVKSPSPARAGEGWGEGGEPRRNG